MNRIIRSTWVAAMIGIAGFPAYLGLLPAATPALAEADEYDVSHNGLLRIGYNERLPAVRHVMVGLNKSMVVELPRDLRDVVVSNPEFLDAVVQTSNRVFLIAKQTGDSNVFFFDENGEQILTLEVRVERDMQVFNRLVERLIPGSHIVAEILNDTIVLSGSVISPADSAKASEIAARFMQRPAEPDQASPLKVVNLLKVEAKEQILLKVTVAEIQREVIKRFGFNWQGGTIGDSAFGLQTKNSFPVSGTFGGDTTLFGIFGPANNLNKCGTVGTLAGVTSAPAGAANCLAQAMNAFERAGALKTLAEPTLTAISGETASFLAGGEFPVPVSEDKTGRISVQWKPFGVGLSFTPLVLSEGRISLKIATEVSELTNEGAVRLATISISGLKVRRANTTVELPSGGSLVIGGLISDDTRQNIDGTPGLKSLPILGTLFRSRDFQKKETELVVIVTPYTVNAVAQSDLTLPTDGFVPATDIQADFLGQLNQVYGRGSELPAGRYHGNYGFIVE